MSDLPVDQRWWPRRLLNRMEVDRAVFYAITARVWQLLAGPVTMVLVATYFSPEVIGFHYTFWAIVALQAVFELSFHQVIINFASHEWEKLSLDANGKIQGDPAAQSRLSSLVRAAFAWYGLASLFFTIVVGGFGLVYFSAAQSSVIAWQAPWLLLVGVSAVTFWTTPALAVLEGCNQVKNVYKIQLVRMVLGNLAVWICIPLGTGLWTAAITVLVRLATEFGLVAGGYHGFFWSGVLKRPQGPTLDWKRDVLPFQKQVGIKGVFNYLNSYLLNLVIFYYHGDVVGGQIGMTWQVLTSMQAACSSWITARAARFGMLVSTKNFAELDRIFYRLLSISMTVMFGLCVIFWGLDFSLYAMNSRFADRLVSPLPTALLSVAVLLNLVPMCQWTYIHAHKQSPFVLVAGVTTGVNCLLVWWLGRDYGVLGTAIALSVVATFVSFPVSTVIWLRCRNEWHADES